MNSPGQSYTISGVKVQFPWRAYPSQLAMMDRIIRGLERQQNALLESPTGSGKSLALLCSALAWQAHEYEKARIEEEREAGSESCCKCRGTGKVPVQVSGGATNSKYFSPGIQQSANPPQTGMDMGASPNHMMHAPCGQTTSGTPGITVRTDAEDDDFRPAAKKFRTPGGVQVRAHHKIMYENDGEDVRDTAGQWSMELNNKTTNQPVEGVEYTCCSCTSEGKEAWKTKKRKVPKIYFGTRTHKQIGQITHELARTAYKNVRMCILASREHTCIHPEVSKMSNKNEECRNKIENHLCRYHDRVKSLSQVRMQEQGLETAWDLEDFVKYCSKLKVCPYYGAREIKDSADIIFSPYNYLTDPVIRASMEINLKNQIVILDEAHNIEDCAREAASCSCTQKQLTEASGDLQYMVDRGVKPIEHGELKLLCMGLDALIDSHKEKLDRADFDQASRVWDGVEMVAQLKNYNISVEVFPRLQKCFATVSEDEADKKRKDEREVTLHASTTMLLKSLIVVLDFIFRDNLKNIDDYRVAIVRSVTYADAGSEKMAQVNSFPGHGLSTLRQAVDSVKRLCTEGVNQKKLRIKGHRQPVWAYTLNFWCLNPAVSFYDIGAAARSIVLTSGTLSPMGSFQSELGVPFPIQLEANHVIGNGQVWVGSIGRGPKGNSLLSSYHNAETFNFQDEVGALLVDICKAIPHGVLCFMPSYKMLDKLSTRWKGTGLWQVLEEHKVVMSEPRSGDKTDFDELMKEYYAVIRDHEDTEHSQAGVTGALFLAVCRGKVSEGMDFTDNNARAVITVGIPFPNIKDTQVDLKKEYNNRHRARGLLTGGEWYEIQAYRALNQALGRCIRHRSDWGALILVDERYGKNPTRYTKGLSKWVRQKVRHFYNFQVACESLHQFTQDRLRMPVPNAAGSQASPACTTQNPVRTPNRNNADASVFPTPVTPGPPQARTLEEQCSSPVLPGAGKTAPVSPVIKTETAGPDFMRPSQAGGFIPLSQDSVPPSLPPLLSRVATAVTTVSAKLSKFAFMKSGNVTPKNNMEEPSSVGVAAENKSNQLFQFVNIPDGVSIKNRGGGPGSATCRSCESPPLFDSEPGQDSEPMDLDNVNFDDIVKEISGCSDTRDRTEPAGGKKSLFREEVNSLVKTDTAGTHTSENPPGVTPNRKPLFRNKATNQNAAVIDPPVKQENAVTPEVAEAQRTSGRRRLSTKRKTSDQFKDVCKDTSVECGKQTVIEPVMESKPNTELNVIIRDTIEVGPIDTLHTAVVVVKKEGTDEIKSEEDTSDKTLAVFSKDEIKEEQSDQGEFEEPLMRSVCTKRKRVNVRKARRKSHGVTYEEDNCPDGGAGSGSDKTPQHSDDCFRCPKCGSPVIKDCSEMRQENYIPTFLRELGQNIDWNTAKPQVMQRKHLNLLLPLTASVAGVTLDSKWSVEDECCVQYVQCGSCAGQSGASPTLLGALVLASVRRNAKVKTNQVWLLPSRPNAD